MVQLGIRVPWILKRVYVCVCVWFPRLPRTCAWTKDFVVVSFTHGMLWLKQLRANARDFNGFHAHLPRNQQSNPDFLWLSPQMHRTAAKHWPWSRQSCTPSRCKGNCPSRVYPAHGSYMLVQCHKKVWNLSNLCLQWMLPWSALWSRSFDHFCNQGSGYVVMAQVAHNA